MVGKETEKLEPGEVVIRQKDGVCYRFTPNGELIVSSCPSQTLSKSTQEPPDESNAP